MALSLFLCVLTCSLHGSNLVLSNVSNSIVVLIRPDKLILEKGFVLVLCCSRLSQNCVRGGLLFRGIIIFLTITHLQNGIYVDVKMGTGYCAFRSPSMSCRVNPDLGTRKDYAYYCDQSSLSNYKDLSNTKYICIYI